MVGGAGNPFDAVTLTADLGGRFSRFSPRINNCGIRLAALMQMIAPQRILICLQVLLAGAVARFAGDAQFSHARLRRAVVGVRSRLAADAVAVNAIPVPGLRRRRQVWIP